MTKLGRLKRVYLSIPMSGEIRIAEVEGVI